MKHMTRKIKCPRCGSEDTCKILYGLPAMSKQMAEDLEHHRIYLGGCLIDEGNPKYHCFNCKEDFGKPVLHLADISNMNLIRKPLYLCINEIYVDIGGCYPGNKHYLLRRYGNFYSVTIESYGAGSPYGYNLSLEEWKRFVKRLYEDCYLEDWEKEYDDHNMLADGVEWELNIKFVDNAERNYYGCNKYPVYWDRFLKLMKSLEREE